MKYAVIRKGDRIPTQSIEKDGTMGGWVRRQAAEDGIALTGQDPFLTVPELEEALSALKARKR